MLGAGNAATMRFQPMLASWLRTARLETAGTVNSGVPYGRPHVHPWKLPNATILIGRVTSLNSTSHAQLEYLDGQCP